MSLMDALHALEKSSIGTAVRELTWLFPAIETIHVFAIVLVVGTIIVVDLRLLNLTSRDRTVSALLADMLPWTWAAFVLAAIAGSLLFTSSPVKYSQNWPFRLKMLAILAAGLNMLVFHLLSYRSVARWDRGDTPGAAKLAGALSILLWFCVISCGRWVGFTTD